jgi:hypothetical protein
MIVDQLGDQDRVLPQQNSGGLSARVNLWSTAIAAFAAFAALILSITASCQLNSHPDLSLGLPKVIFVQSTGAMPGNSAMLVVYMAPAFAVSAKADVQDQVVDARIILRRPPGVQQAANIDLPWTAFFDIVEIEQGESTTNVRSRPADTVTGFRSQLRAKFADVSSPFAVSAEKAESHTMSFQTSYDYLDSANQGLTPGTWQGELTITRLEQEPLVKPFCIDISEEVAADLYIALRSERGNESPFFPFFLSAVRSTDQSSQSCYHS